MTLMTPYSGELDLTQASTTMPPSRTQQRSSKSNSTTRGAHKNTGPGTGVEPEAFLEAVEGVLGDPERSVDQ